MATLGEETPDEVIRSAIEIDNMLRLKVTI